MKLLWCLILPVACRAAMYPGILAQPVYYVDSGGGSDSNTGLSPAQAWATVAHADAAVPVNTIPALRLKLPNGAWVQPPSWRRLKALYFLQQATGTSGVAEVANGANGTLSGAAPYSGAYVDLVTGASQYVNLGSTRLQMGTGDMTAILDADFSQVAGNDAFFSSGAYGGLAGWCIFAYSGTLRAQLRDGSGSVIEATQAAQPWASTNRHFNVVGFTAHRGGNLQMYMDGSPTGSPRSLTGSWTTASITSTATGAIGARDNGSFGQFATERVSWAAVFSRELSAPEMAAWTSWLQTQRWSYFPYQANFFSGNWYTAATFQQQRSVDGINFYVQDNATYPVAPTTYGFANAYTVRAPGGKCWLAHQTPLNYLAGPYLAESMDCTHWRGVGTVNWPARTTDALGVGGWFVDDDGSVHMTADHCPGTCAGTGSMVEVHPLNAQMTGYWSAPVALGVAADTGENPALVKVGSTYNLFYSHTAGGNYPIYQATSTSLTGPYTVTNTNPLGLGTTVNQDALSVLSMGGSTWRLYFDQASPGEYYVQSTNNWSSFGPAVAVQPLTTWHASSIILRCLPGSTLPMGCS